MEIQSKIHKQSFYCRTCLTSAELLIPMENHLRKILLECGSVVIVPLAGVELMICQTCKSIIENYNKLKLRALEVEIAFSNIYNQSLKVEPDDSELNNSGSENFENDFKEENEYFNCDPPKEIDGSYENTTIENVDKTSEDTALPQNHFNCNKCSEAFKTKLERKTHKLKTHPHPSNKLISCEQCSKQYKGHFSLKKHWMKFHKNLNAPMTCHYCSEGFFDKKVLKGHITIRHTEKKPISIETESIKCEKCDKIFANKKKFTDHRLRFHVRPSKMKMTCSQCSKRFTGHYSLTKHWLNIHKNIQPPLKCKICSRNFYNQEVFDNHVEIRHNKELPKSFTCSYCKKEFRTRYKFERHMKIQTKLQFKCQYVSLKTLCPCCGLSVLAIESHMPKCQKRKLEGKTYNCRFCKHNFNIMSELLEHQKKVHAQESADQELKYQCELCGRKFARRKNLLAHSFAHKEIRPFPCDICAKAFKRPSELRSHMKRHYDERPWSCKDCGSRFLEKAKLKEHQRIHTGEKPFGCKICSATFSRTIGLKTHMKIHMSIELHAGELLYLRKRKLSAKENL